MAGEEGVDDEGAVRYPLKIGGAEKEDNCVVSATIAVVAGPVSKDRFKESLMEESS